LPVIFPVQIVHRIVSYRKWSLSIRDASAIPLSCLEEFLETFASAESWDKGEPVGFCNQKSRSHSTSEWIS